MSNIYENHANHIHWSFYAPTPSNFHLWGVTGDVTELKIKELATPANANSEYTFNETVYQNNRIRLLENTVQTGRFAFIPELDGLESGHEGDIDLSILIDGVAHSVSMHLLNGHTNIKFKGKGIGIKSTTPENWDQIIDVMRVQHRLNFLGYNAAIGDQVPVTGRFIVDSDGSISDTETLSTLAAVRIYQGAIEGLTSGGKGTIVVRSGGPSHEPLRLNEDRQTGWNRVSGRAPTHNRPEGSHRAPQSIFDLSSPKAASSPKASTAASGSSRPSSGKSRFRISATLPRRDRQNRNYSRVFFAGAIDQKLDKQGRVQIPADLREYAGLDKEVTVVGVAERIEIWNTSTWQELTAGADDEYADIDEA